MLMMAMLMAAMSQSSFAVFAEDQEKEYVLSCKSGLHPGDQVVIVSEQMSESYAMTANLDFEMQENYVMCAQKVDVRNNTIIDPPEDCVWTIGVEWKGVDKVYTFSHDGSVLASSEKRNGLTFDTGYDRWQIDGGVDYQYSITNVESDEKICLFDNTEIWWDDFIWYHFSTEDCGYGLESSRVYFYVLHTGTETDPPTPSTPEYTEGFKHTLNLESDISVNFWLSKYFLKEQGVSYPGMTLVCTLKEYDGNELVGEKEMRIAPVEYGDFYYFPVTGLTAVNMNDILYVGVEAYVSVEGEDLPMQPNDLLFSEEYSIAEYAYSQLNKEGATDQLKSVCAGLLRYGGKAQTYKGYRTDALADSAMTEEHKSYLSDLDRVSFGNTDQILDDLAEAPIPWVGKSLNLGSKVALKFAFDPTEYAGDVSALTLKVSYRDIKNEEKTVVVEAPELYNEENGFYAFTVDCLLATELRTVVSAQIFAGDTPVSSTLQYSADTYGNGREGALLDLCKALFAYSDSAKIFFD